MNLDPDDLRREIDETLAELEEVEAEVMELFAELGGPEAVRQIAAYKEAQANLPRNTPLRHRRTQ